MRIRYAITTTDELRMLCIKNNWFTGGTISQYEKMFELNRNDVGVREIALVIWLCSDASLEEIEKKLSDAKVDYQMRCLAE